MELVGVLYFKKKKNRATLPDSNTSFNAPMCVCTVEQNIEQHKHQTKKCTQQTVGQVGSALHCQFTEAEDRQAGR